MSEAVAKLKPLLAALTADERAEVTEFLATLGNGSAEGEEEGLTSEDWEAAWAEEIDRPEEMDSGKVKGIPADEFMKRMKEKYG